MKELKDLSKEELLHLIKSYDEYIQNGYTEKAGYFTTDWRPACIEEFYTEQYQEFYLD